MLQRRIRYPHRMLHLTTLVCDAWRVRRHGPNGCPTSVMPTPAIVPASTSFALRTRSVSAILGTARVGSVETTSGKACGQNTAAAECVRCAAVAEEKRQQPTTSTLLPFLSSRSVPLLIFRSLARVPSTNALEGATEE
jgi:hypothetical protein